MSAIEAAVLQADLPRYLERVAGGEALVITRNDEPVAELHPPTPRGRARRPFALCRGQFVVPDDFDDALPEHVLAGFEGQ